MTSQYIWHGNITNPTPELTSFSCSTTGLPASCRTPRLTTGLLSPVDSDQLWRAVSVISHSLPSLNFTIPWHCPQMPRFFPSHFPKPAISPTQAIFPSLQNVEIFAHIMMFWYFPAPVSRRQMCGMMIWETIKCISYSIGMCCCIWETNTPI